MRFLKTLTISIFAMGWLMSASLQVTPAHAAPALVVGENLKVGMPLNQAISLLGIPESFIVRRGTDTEFDSVKMMYPAHGVAIHALNKGKVVEEIEVLDKFTGKFDTGIKIGDGFKTIISKYGRPESLTENMARYPERGYFFYLKDDMLFSAKVFTKGSKLLNLRKLTMAK